MEFGVELDQTTVDVLHEMTSNFHQNPCLIFCRVCKIFLCCDILLKNIPLKNVTWIFSCLFDGNLVENETKSDGNPIIFLATAMEIPRPDVFQNPCHSYM